MGFATSIKGVGDIVGSYVQYNDSADAKTRLRYKGNEEYPGPDWTSLFLEKNNLSLKDVSKLTVARYSVTKNPFIINHYYDILEESIQKLGPQNHPDLIWNMDETGLHYEPKKCKVISEKG